MLFFVISINENNESNHNHSCIRVCIYVFYYIICLVPLLIVPIHHHHHHHQWFQWYALCVLTSLNSLNFEPFSPLTDEGQTGFIGSEWTSEKRGKRNILDRDTCCQLFTTVVGVVQGPSVRFLFIVYYEKSESPVFPPFLCSTIYDPSPIKFYARITALKWPCWGPLNKI